MSSDDVAIQARNIAKSFKVDGKSVKRGPSEIDAREGAGRFFNNRFKALDDVSLAVRCGETVGIVGRNGAGKSTLLRIISGMMHPDSGTVEVAGPAYSVMGMGIGFDRNLTGKDNIQIKGAVMGAASRQIDERFDWIVDFAELGDYIHQPLRTYSKGMLSRLAFAITFAFDPEILIVDEALSGGDGAFKRKAEARLNEINDSGATILLVSHSPMHHKRLCDRSILLDKGRVLNDGPPPAILKYYDQLLEARPETEAAVIAAIEAADPHAAPGEADADSQAGLEPATDFFDDSLTSASRSQSKPDGARVMQTELLDPKAGEPINTVLAGSPMRLSATVEFLAKMDEVELEFTVKTEDGVELFQAGVRRTRSGPSRFRKKGLVHTFNMNLKNRLLPGVYFVDVVVRGDTGRGVAAQHRVSDAVVFRSTGRAGVEGLVDLHR